MAIEADSLESVVLVNSLQQYTARPNTPELIQHDINPFAPTEALDATIGRGFLDVNYSGFIWGYTSSLAEEKTGYGLYKITNNVRAATPILWVDSNGKVTFNSEAFAQAPTLANHVATKAYVDANGGGVQKSYVDQQDAATLASAKTYADTGDTTTLTSAKTFATSGDTTTLTSAKAYSDTGDASTLTSAKAYTDSSVSLTLTSAKSYADTGDSTTLSAAKTFATNADTTVLASAKSYADTGDASTLTTAKTYSDTGDANTLASAKAWAIAPHTKTITYTMDTPTDTQWVQTILGGLNQQGYQYEGTVTWDFSAPSITFNISQGAQGVTKVLTLGAIGLNLWLNTIEGVTSSTNPQGVLNKFDVEAKIATGDSATLTSANNYADTGDVSTLNSAKSYSDTGDANTLTAAKAYTDSKPSGGLPFDSNGIATISLTGKATPLILANIDSGKAWGYQCSYAGSGSLTNFDTLLLDSSTRSFIYKQQDSGGGSVNRFQINGSQMTAYTLTSLISNNSTSYTAYVFLVGNGSGWFDTFSQTGATSWSRTIGFNTTTYLTLQNVSGTNTISASQPIVMSSTYTPTAAKYVATKDYVDLGAIPIGGILDVPSGATLPSNFLNANGSNFNPGTYPTLYSLLGSSVTPSVTARVSGFKCIIRAS